MFTATNTSAVACSMSGYPAVAPYRTQAGGGGSSSVQASVAPISSQAGPIGGAAQVVTLPPGQAAVFFLMWSTGGASCQMSDGITFNTPTTSTFAIVAFPFRFCGNTIKQSVVLPPGTSA
jgi:hypothetical protein